MLFKTEAALQFNSTNSGVGDDLNRGRIAKGYDNWGAIAGFFDGDGSLDIAARTFTLHWILSFTDNWPPQLAQVKRFLESQGISVGIVRATGTGGYKIQVAGILSLRKCAQAMLSGNNIFKKRRELELLLDYYDGKITGDQVIAAFNEEVRNGIRVGKLRSSNLPYTYFDGIRAYNPSRWGKPRVMLSLGDEDRMKVKELYSVTGLTIYQIAKEYGVAPSTIFLIVRGLRRPIKTQRVLPSPPPNSQTQSPLKWLSLVS